MIDEVKPISRIVAALLFAALCVLVVAIYVFGYTGEAATRAQVDDTQAQVAALDARIGQIAANGNKNNAAGGGGAWIAASTTGVAAASVQKLVGGIITGAGATLREVQIIEPDPDAPQSDGPTPVSAVFLVETTHPGLRQILMGIAAARPLLKTEKLSIEALPKPEGEGAEMPLRIEVQVTGYWVKVSA